MEASTDSTKKKDVERFIKFFVIKSIQVVVQSRTTDKKVKTECRLPSDGGNVEWFNLQIPCDNPLILTQTQPHLDPLTKDHCQICIEIYLKSEEVQILLEVWRFQVDKPSLQSASKDVNNIYNRLALLLKSLITVTRVTPAYKIVRRGGGEVVLEWGVKSCSKERGEGQGEEDGGGGMKVEEDLFEEDLKNSLGDGYKAVEVGRVPLTTSSLNQNFIICNLYYRTKMELLTTTSPLLIHSNHYGEDCVREKKKVRAAFGSIDSLSHLNSDSDSEENFLKLIPGGEFLLLSQKEKSSISIMQKTSQIEESITIENKLPSPIHTKVVQKIQEEKISFPFAEPKTSSSSSSETELLNLFEEFRVAPSSLNFSESCHDGLHGSEGGENLNEFEEEVGFYDDFVNRLVNEIQ